MSETEHLSNGDKAPEFDLPVTGGSNVKLSELIGSPLVLFFYPKDNTAGCTREACEFSDTLPQFAELGVAVFGVSPDPIKSHEKFRDKHGLAMPLISDESKEMLTAYNVWVKKKMYGREYMGVERSTFLIDHQGRIAKIWRKVKIDGHVEEVFTAAKELAGME